MKKHLDIKSAYYILGLEPGASFAQVKQAYRQLVKIWHPDCFSDLDKKEQAEQKIKTINEAYELLKSYQADSSNQPKFSSQQQTNKPGTHKPQTNKSQTDTTQSDKEKSEPQAEKKTTKVYVYRSNAQTFYQSGVDKANEGRYEEAIADFTRAIHLNAHYVEAYKYRAFVCHKLGYKHRANADLNQAARIEENFRFNRTRNSSPDLNSTWREAVHYRKKSFLERLWDNFKAFWKKIFLGKF